MAPGDVPSPWQAMTGELFGQGEWQEPMDTKNLNTVGFLGLPHSWLSLRSSPMQQPQKDTNHKSLLSQTQDPRDWNLV